MTRAAGLGIPRADYHSAHKPPIQAQPQWVYEGQGIGVSARVLDIMDDTPEAILSTNPGYASCDVLVTDLPWQRGFEVFNERAGIDDGRNYAGFMRAVRGLVETATVPTWLITGLHALRHLPKPDLVLPMRLNDDEAVAIGYRPGPEAFSGDYPIAQEFLHTLAEHYECAGDFCCGYGRTGRFFARAGKRAVLSDFNPRCIGYIADHADQWTTP